MRIVVFGGTGHIGSPLVRALQHRGHAVAVASRANGVDAVSGAGVDAAVSGADVVVDVLNAGWNEPGSAREFFVKSSETLMRAGARAGVRHHVVLSIVGADRVKRDGYFKAKAVQEDLVSHGSVPFSILRATQFFEFARLIAAWNTREDTVRLPPLIVRPVASTDVVARLVHLAECVPSNMSHEIAGPEPLPLDEFVRRVLLKDHSVRYVFTDPFAVPSGFDLDGELLLPGEGAFIGRTTLEQWLHRARMSSVTP